jgi:hypothetical protein
MTDVACLARTLASAANNDIDFLPDELGNDLGCALAASLRPSNLDRGSAPLDPTDCMQPLYESGDRLALKQTRRRA